MDTPIHQYTSTKRDFLDAQRLHRRNRKWTAVGFYFWFVAIPALAVAASLYTLVVFLTWGRDAAMPLLPLAGGLAYAAILFWVARWFQIRRLWNNAQPPKYRGLPVTFQFDDAQVISARPGESEGRFFWNAIEDFAEDDRLALLYVRRKLFLFIPKRAMDDGEWARLRALALLRKATK